ncbi:glycoside hydrolase [Marinilabilia rubra]|uniref:Glycosyl hydrolase n=1 Tax=Marinilabilia rubra TaxID=2162893 RepID=A0A2U2B5Z9_9BACT|nr:glycoside hydrolase [Marinilabilia rubra]PWD98476.1 glycosyl hydrolase [Marinilabilia rubra]
MKISWAVLFSSIFLLFSSCEKDSGGNNEDPNKEGDLIFVDPSVEMQEMEGFGASDSWRVQFVGKNWPLEKRNAMADLLFSKDLKEDGSPEGIGLSLWRFYIGAGSAEQGVESDIQNSWRRAECFLTEDGSYDWSKQQGQQWFLQAAKERGLESVLGYAISPPVYYTKNGKAYSPGGNNINLDAGRMNDYAEFLATVSEHFQNQGIPFDYLSPVNEPQWDWESPGQEGSPATNQDIAGLVRELSPKLHEKGLQTQIILPEAAELQFLYGENGKPERQNQMEAFFSATSPDYIGGMNNVKDVVLGHSYFTTANIPTLIGVRQNLGRKLNTFGGAPGYWQSEFCILENTDDIGGGWGRDLGIGTALYVARVIHFDLTLANAQSWSWWTALSQYDYKDGLIYLDNGNDGINGPHHPDSETLKMDGFYRESKLLWALGNFSRFIRPGMVRVKSGFSIPKSEELQASNLMFSAYKDPQSGKLVVVFVNYSERDKQVNIGSLGEAFSVEGNVFDSYTTSASQDLQKGTMPADEITIGKRSVVTLVGMIN